MRENLEQSIDTVALADGVTLEDHWFALRAMDGGTLAIGEPAYHQCNWSYLISSGDESLLWDTGSGRRPIAPLVARHGQAQVQAFPSHMHFDHLGGVTDFGPVILADLPVLRGFARSGIVRPPEAYFLGASEGVLAPRFPVGRWISPGEALTIGRTRIDVLHTPGHSPESVSLWDAERMRLYAADLLYRGELYAQTPGASLPDYVRTLRELLRRLPRDVQIVGAHGEAVQGTHDVPILGYGDVEDTLCVLETLLTEAPHEGACAINDRMALRYSEDSFTR